MLSVLFVAGSPIAAEINLAALPAYDALEGPAQPALRNSERERLITRWFQLDPALMAKKYGDQSLLTNFLNSLRQVGVDLRPPKNCFYSHGKGFLMIRGTEDDLEMVQRQIKEVQSSSPVVAMQINLVRYPAEKGADILRLLEVANSPGGAFIDNLSGPWSGPLVGRSNPNKTSEAMSPSKTPASWILTKGLNEFILDKLGTSADAEVLAGPRFFSPNQLWTSVDLGKQMSQDDRSYFPAVDLEPVVAADRRTVHLNLRQRSKELAGYDLSGQSDAWDYVESDGANPAPRGSHDLSIPSILPPTAIYNQVQSSNSITIAAGQTLVVSGLMPEIQLPKGREPLPWLRSLLGAGDLLQGQPTTSKPKKLLIFITPVLPMEHSK